MVNYNQPQQKILDKLFNLFQKGTSAESAQRAHPLIKQYPNAFILWNILGASLRNLGKIEKAAFAFEKVTELNSKYAEGYNNLGVTLNELGKFDKAERAFIASLAIKTSKAEIIGSPVSL